MSWPLTALALFAVVVLIAVKLFRAQIEKAGAPLVVPLVILVVAAVGLTVYQNQKEMSLDTQGEESPEGGPGGMRGGGGGGRGSWRERFKQTFELVAMVRKLPLMDKQEAVGLSSEQAVSLAPLLQSLETDEKLTQDQAKAKVEAIKKVLTAPQLEALDKIELPRRRFRGRRGGPPSTPEGGPPGERREQPVTPTPPAIGALPDPPAGKAPAAPTGTATSRTAAPTGEARPQPEGRGKGRRGGRGRFSPDMNPFQRERSKPALTELLGLLDKRQKGETPAPETAKPGDAEANQAPAPGAAKQIGD